MDIQNKHVLVTGVTGTLGKSVAKRFVKQGAIVRGLIRNKEDAQTFLEIGITPVLGELTDRSSLLEAVSDVDILVHCAAYLGEDPHHANAANVTGVENIVDIALHAGVQKFIHISTISVYGEPTEGFYDETSPLAFNHPEVYVDTKVKSEQILQQYIDKGLDIVILRPGSICAEENSYWGDRQITRMHQTDVVDWVHPEDSISWIHTENLVEMIFLVIKKDINGQAYNAIDGNFLRRISGSGLLRR